MPAIDVHGLRKDFPQGKGRALTAVDNLTVSVEEGEVFGFLGPNGAGKTTTVRLLCALIAPTAGTAYIHGLDVRTQADAVRRTVGILTETPGLYDRLSAARNLRLFADLYDVPNPSARVEHYLRLFDLWGRHDDEAGSYSKGMRQKLAIARALLHDPKALFLDEPTSGLDPAAARLVREAIERLRGEGRTIFLCTHNLDEADRLCDRVGIFKQTLLTVDTPANLRRSLFGRQVVFHLRALDPAWVEQVRALPAVSEVTAVDNKLVARVAEPERDNPAIVRALVTAGAEVQFVGELRRSLEEVYLHWTRQEMP